MRPSSSASSISLVNRPLPPISSSRRSWIRSPVVVMTTSGATPFGVRRVGAQGGGDPALHLAGLGEGQLGAAGADADGRLRGHGRRLPRPPRRLLQERAPPGNRMTPSTQTVLGIETSCDETAAAVVRLGTPTAAVEVLSSVVASQIADHAPFGGRGAGDRRPRPCGDHRRHRRPGAGRRGRRRRRPRRRRGHRRAGPGGRGDGGPVVRQGHGPGPRPAADRGQPPGGPRGLGAAGRRHRLSLPAAAGLRRPLPAAGGGGRRRLPPAGLDHRRRRRRGLRQDRQDPGPALSRRPGAGARWPRAATPARFPLPRCCWAGARAATSPSPA